jgi:hypothetical protein
MSKRVLAVALLALMLSLALMAPAGAEVGYGFNVDCTGAYGYGTVPAGEYMWWSIRLYVPGVIDQTWDGEMTGPGAFDEVIQWPVPITGGTDPDDPYYWVSIFTPDGTYCYEGHFDCEPPPPPGEGCTPGYWRNHYDAWVGYSPIDDFDTTFSTDYFDPDITLGDAIWMGGGGVKKLARHGTAALLNAASPDVDYPLTVAEVIALVQAGDATTLADYNEDLPCPLN